jgi:hypothetical protein
MSPYLLVEGARSRRVPGALTVLALKRVTTRNLTNPIRPARSNGKPTATPIAITRMATTRVATTSTVTIHTSITGITTGIMGGITLGGPLTGCSKFREAHMKQPGAGGVI